jgi:hypothetical protein
MFGYLLITPSDTIHASHHPKISSTAAKHLKTHIYTHLTHYVHLFGPLMLCSIQATQTILLANNSTHIHAGQPPNTLFLCRKANVLTHTHRTPKSSKWPTQGHTHTHTHTHTRTHIHTYKNTNTHKNTNTNTTTHLSHPRGPLRVPILFVPHTNHEHPCCVCNTQPEATDGVADPGVVVGKGTEVQPPDVERKDPHDDGRGLAGALKTPHTCVVCVCVVCVWCVCLCVCACGVCVLISL